MVCIKKPLTPSIRPTLYTSPCVHITTTTPLPPLTKLTQTSTHSFSHKLDQTDRMSVHISSHPCLLAKLSQIRSHATTTRETRSLVTEISTILGVEALAGLSVARGTKVTVHRENGHNGIVTANRTNQPTERRTKPPWASNMKPRLSSQRSWQLCRF